MLSNLTIKRGSKYRGIYIYIGGRMAGGAGIWEKMSKNGVNPDFLGFKTS